MSAMTTNRRTGRAAALVTAVVLGTLAPAADALAASGPSVPPAPAAASATDRAAADRAAAAPATQQTLSRFFSRDGAVSPATADPRVESGSVPVYMLSAGFVAGKPGAPVAELRFFASRAVSSDGQKASVWSVRQDGKWQVVNIATGDDEIRYGRHGAAALPGGTVFQEPQINAWYVTKGNKVLPLDEDARNAIGRDGSTLTAYQDRVEDAYADKLPGSEYAKKGAAGGYGPAAPAPAAPPAAEAAADGTVQAADRVVTPLSAVAGTGALLALALCGATVGRRRRRAGAPAGRQA